MRWFIPGGALIFSLFIHLLVFKIDWPDNKKYEHTSITVTIKKQKIKKQQIKKKSKITLTKKNSKKNSVDNSLLALKLIQETISFVRNRSSFDYQFEYEQNWRKSITENVQPKFDNSISEYTEKNANVHIKIAGVCFVYREPNPLWQFDESIFVVEVCGSRYN